MFTFTYFDNILYVICCNNRVLIIIVVHDVCNCMGVRIYKLYNICSLVFLVVTYTVTRDTPCKATLVVVNGRGRRFVR